MKSITVGLCILSMLVLLVAGSAAAQSQSGSQMPMGGQSGGQTAPMMPGMMGTGGMCPMMGGGMAGGMGMMGMMSMMGGAQDAKVAGRMLQMRADMMRAVADVLAKYGKAMEEGK
ncbi:MAG: hypothetical protein HY002_08500 [Candidatus Rokubacteria bacterium]|nr:hypothetical protein [Candidatus Rokubacteria bacterium]